MAKLAARPIDFPKFKNNKDIDRQQDALDILIDKSNQLDPNGPTLVGALWKYPVADGHAYYVVTKDKPLTLAHIPFLDEYAVPEFVIRGLKRSDIQLMLEFDQSWEKLVNKRVAQLSKPPKKGA
jgi:hypothetical protein